MPLRLNNSRIHHYELAVPYEELAGVLERADVLASTPAIPVELELSRDDGSRVVVRPDLGGLERLSIQYDRVVVRWPAIRVKRSALPSDLAPERSAQVLVKTRDRLLLIEPGHAAVFKWILAAVASLMLAQVLLPLPVLFFLWAGPAGGAALCLALGAGLYALRHRAKALLTRLLHARPMVLAGRLDALLAPDPEARTVRVEGRFEELSPGTGAVSLRARYFVGDNLEAFVDA